MKRYIITLIVLAISISGLQAQIGNSPDNPIVIGIDQSFEDTKEVYGSVSYWFKTYETTVVTISNCGSRTQQSSISLYDSSDTLLESASVSDWNPQCETSHGYIRKCLPAGVYKIICQGYIQNWTSITTSIVAEDAVITDAGTYSSSFVYTDTQRLYDLMSCYHNGNRNYMLHRFTIATPTNITISHCGSSIYDTRMFLSGRLGVIAYCDDYTGQGGCNSPAQAYIYKPLLPAGTYYVVSDGASAGNISIRIEGDMPPPPNPPGNKPDNALDLGQKWGEFIYSDTHDTNGFTKDYYRSRGNDVFHKITLMTPMDITISHCGSQINDTHVILLDNSCTNEVALNYTNTGGCSNPLHAYLKVDNLAAGTYYVVSAGEEVDGNLTTYIHGKPNPQGNSMTKPLSIGSHYGAFTYTNAQNTVSFTNEYNGQPTNDVFYTFTLQQPMDITISHCGSDLADTYVHLLNSAGTRIAYNDDYSGAGACSNTMQAYLKTSQLAAGTYYVVSEGKAANGIIVTSIEGRPDPQGNRMSTALDLGSKSSGFVYSNTQNTEGFTNDYQGQSTNDVFYKFTLTKAMDITISHCGSGVSDTYVHLLNSVGTRIAYNDNYYGEGACGNTAQAYVKVDNLAAGTYYIVSEGNNTNGSITTIIQGVVPPPNPPGNKIATALNLGSKSGAFVYTDTQDTNGFTDEYRGQSTNDVFYAFSLTTPLDITISHCGSGITDTYLHLLDINGNRIAYNDDYSGAGACNSPLQSYLKMESLSVGTYYVVSEGKTANGSIITRIEGSVPPPNPPGNKMNSALDLGSKSSGFIYSDIQDTNGFSNEYNGQPTNDVFYKFTLATPMHITISHCGSELNDTYLHLLNAAGTCIDYNDDYSVGDVCRNPAQSYLRKENLPAGTYYVVSEGKTANGKIYTYIEGDKYIAPNASTSQNYIMTITPTIPTSTVDGITTNNALKSIQYFDGLGRPVQTVQIKATPDKSDLVTYQEYDNHGRESKSWLPVVAVNNNGAFVSYNNFVSKSLDTYNNDPKSYNQPVYENSPLNRLLEQYGPGQDWHNNSKAVRTAYLSNNSTYPCKLYSSTDNRETVSIAQTGSTANYDDNQLHVTQLTDEDDNISFEFKNKLGQVVLTRQMEGTEPHDTYYIYDSYGNLRVVLPPLAADTLNNGRWGEDNITIQQYAYLYKYDSRNRCIAKKLPGAEWIYYVYDKADQLIFTQDGEQRTRGEWTFNIPDVHGRIVLNGICSNELVYPTQLTTVVSGTWANITNDYKGYTLEGVTLEEVKDLTVNYYDSYEFMENASVLGTDHNSFGFEAQGGLYQQAEHSKGFHTGTLTAILDEAYTDTKLITVMYYDYQGRVIQNHKGNLLDGIDTQYIHYTFTGQPIYSEHIHTADQKQSLVERQTYTYDHAERLLKVEHQLQVDEANNEKVTLLKCTYDELGRLQSKRLHEDEGYPISYSYNIRNWMSEINGSLFYQKLYYNTGLGEPLYNGNISSMIWKANDSYIRGYKFNYDGLNRLLEANYGEGESMTSAPNYFTEKVTGYDKHGNIMGLKRYVGTRLRPIGVNPKLVDDIEISYKGNQLSAITDAPIPQTSPGSITSPVTNLRGYFYDTNGNINKYISEKIIDIQYNVLNLPKRVNFLDNKSISYTYDAVGVKHKVSHQNGNVTKNTHYCGNVIYENGELSKILTEEGYITLAGITPTYHYFLKDHLGSNRVVIDQNGTVEQRTHYYPFGGTFEQTAESVQPFKYNGKELDRTFDLNLYDYSARYMEPTIGRFTTMDPMAEKYYSISPYAYCNNNPMRYVDPTGMEPEDDNMWARLGKYLKDLFSVKVDTSSEEAKTKTIERYNNQLETIESITEGVEVVNMGISVVMPASSAVELGVAIYTGASTEAVVTAAASVAVDAVTGGEGRTIKTITKGGKVLKSTKKSSKTIQGVSSNFTTTPQGVTLPKGIDIPANYIENPNRKGSYGVIFNGKFVEKLRIDPATKPGSKGPNNSHFHIDGKGKHETDLNKWPK